MLALVFYDPRNTFYHSFTWEGSSSQLLIEQYRCMPTVVIEGVNNSSQQDESLLLKLYRSYVESMEASTSVPVVQFDNLLEHLMYRANPFLRRGGREQLSNPSLAQSHESAPGRFGYQSFG